MSSKLEIRVFLKNTLTVQEIHAFEKKEALHGQVQQDISSVRQITDSWLQPDS